MVTEVNAMTNVLIAGGISMITSFVGSFLCFVIWVHFDFDSRWEERKYEHHKRELDKADRYWRERGIDPVDAPPRTGRPSY